MRPQFLLRARRPVAVGAMATIAACASAVAHAQSHDAINVNQARTHVLADRAVVVQGGLRPARQGATVVLQTQRGGNWSTVARAVTDATGRYRLRYRAHRTGSWAARVRLAGPGADTSVRHDLGRLNVYRRAAASWYGPGLFGSHLACGGRLTPGTLGVANKSLPCGTKVTLRYRGRSVRVPVVDRGPYVAGREYDLTSATKARLGFRGHGYVLATR